VARGFHKVAVVGAGAVGSYFGGMLARSGVKVVLIGREAHMQAIRADGLLLDSVRFQEKVQVQATTDLAAVAQADLVLFSVKSYDTAAAASLMTTRLAQDAIIVSLQNGVENAEIISRATGRRALPAVVYVAVELVAPGHVRHKARGDLIVGDPAGRDRLGNDVARVAALFESAQVPCRVSQNIQGELWFKLIVNAAGNGVTALARASYGEVAKHLLGREVMAAVVREAEAVARAAGVELPAGDLVSQVLSLAEAMGDAHSSTLQDILRGKRTEIGELNGYIAEMGRKYGVATPVNSTIHSLVRILEAGVIERLR
jgi:2-dehydropantoate 2-reductase